MELDLRMREIGARCRMNAKRSQLIHGNGEGWVYVDRRGFSAHFSPIVLFFYAGFSDYLSFLIWVEVLSSITIP